MQERPNQAATSSSFEFAALDQAVHYRQALIREFSPTLRGRVIEIGSGIGQLTRCLRELPGVEHLLAIEPDAGFCAQIAQKLPGQRVICGTAADIPSGETWNAILSVNVLEHIREDERELHKYYQLLRPCGGALNLFVPARPEIYAPIDRDFGHHRRYTRAELRRKLTQAGFKIERLRYYNFIGYFAWWAAFCALKKREFDAASVRFFDRMLFPVINGLETRWISPPIGQSLLAIART